jgi:hypothetical protein
MQNICNKEGNPEVFFISLQLPSILSRIIDEKAFRQAPYQQRRNIDRMSEEMYNMLTNYVKATDRMNPESRSGRWEK